jgi:hypothetical protein
MQFFILFIGAMVFVFYQFATPPLFFNPVEENKVKSGIYAEEYKTLEKDYDEFSKQKQNEIRGMLSAVDSGNKEEIKKFTNKITASQEKALEIKKKSVDLIKKANASSDGNDTNYIFISFVINFLPVGLVGLVIAAILSASMSSTAAELNALASTTVIDVYKRLINKDADDMQLHLRCLQISWGHLLKQLIFLDH